MVEEQFITSVAEGIVDMPTHPVGSQIPATQKLPAVSGTKEMAVFLLLIVLFISNVTGVQFGGPATFLYWAPGILTFLIPSAFVTRWLALRFPGQGAPYIYWETGDTRSIAAPSIPVPARNEEEEMEVVYGN